MVRDNVFMTNDFVESNTIERLYCELAAQIRNDSKLNYNFKLTIVNLWGSNIYYNFRSNDDSIFKLMDFLDHLKQSLPKHSLIYLYRNRTHVDVDVSYNILVDEIEIFKKHIKTIEVENMSNVDWRSRVYQIDAFFNDKKSNLLPPEIKLIDIDIDVIKFVPDDLMGLFNYLYSMKLRQYENYNVKVIPLKWHLDDVCLNNLEYIYRFTDFFNFLSGKFSKDPSIRSKIGITVYEFHKLKELMVVIIDDLYYKIFELEIEDMLNNLLKNKHKRRIRNVY